jgi:phosphoglycolate phosphatase
VLLQRALGPEHQDRLEDGVAAFMTYYGAHLLDETRPYPGVVDALTAIAARGGILSVLTNKPIALTRAILDGLALTSRFVDVIGGDSLPVRKPDPSGMEQLRARSATPRERMLFVGDSAIDVRTARAAGVTVCGVAWGLVPESLRAEPPDHQIHHPAELLPIVERG